MANEPVKAISSLTFDCPWCGKENIMDAGVNHQCKHCGEYFHIIIKAIKGKDNGD